MTPEFTSRSFRIIRSSMIIFGMIVGLSISTNAETVKVMDEASTDVSFTIAQTNGMERRGDRRDTRQDCRQGKGPSARTSATANSRDARSSRGTPARGVSTVIKVWRDASDTGPCCVTVTHTPASAILGDSAHFGTLREGCHFSAVVHSNLDRMRRSCQCSVETPVPSDDMSGFCARRSDRFWRV